MQVYETAVLSWSKYTTNIIVSTKHICLLWISFAAGAAAPIIFLPIVLASANWIQPLLVTRFWPWKEWWKPLFRSTTCYRDSSPIVNHLCKKNPMNLEWLCVCPGCPSIPREWRFEWQVVFQSPPSLMMTLALKLMKPLLLAEATVCWLTKSEAELDYNLNA